MAQGQPRTPAIARAAGRVAAAKRWKNAKLLAEAEAELEAAWAEAAEQGIFRYHETKPRVYCPTVGCDRRLDYMVPLPKFCPQCGTKVNMQEMLRQQRAAKTEDKETQS